MMQSSLVRLLSMLIPIWLILVFGEPRAKWVDLFIPTIPGRGQASCKRL
jgi:hypothetical protein